MQYRLWFVLLYVLAIVPSPAGEVHKMLTMLSPKLRHFLADNVAASNTLTTVASEALQGRTLRLYYSYSEDDSTADSSHYYPSDRELGIIIRENQQTADEFICLVFELLNSEGESRFRELLQQARSGSISKQEFTQEVLRREFVAVNRTRDLLRKLKLPKRDLSKCHSYKQFLECPDTFEGFIEYTKKISSPGRDPFREYGDKYDSLRKESRK